MLKVTADTNTLISATITKGNEFELLNLARLGKLELILSPQILKEFKEVISRPKFGFSQKQIFKALKQIINISTIVMPSIKINVIKEYPEDNRVLECAETGKANYIVSGDNHLLNLKKYKNIKIIKTKVILDII
ncbi:MAG: putative toxin-antitoxin system toxin component, PIN family [Candidatus Woesearchaeota archaeon]